MLKNWNTSLQRRAVISKKIKANFKTLGAKLGASMKEAAAAIAGFTQDQIAALESAGSIQLALSAGSICH
jgi:isoleucyl-tRNA synthetase